MRYCHLLSVAFAFGFLFTAAPAQADSRTKYPPLAKFLGLEGGANSLLRVG